MPARSSPAPKPPHPEPAPEAAPPAPAAADRIVLTGFMGSGKTTAGQLLARRLGWEFLDLDREIERRDGRSVPAIFAESGELHFRQLETSTLGALLARPRTVLALGGGAPEQPANRLLLQRAPATPVIYLCAPLPTLLDRCRQQAARPGSVARPLLPEAESRFHTRHPLYGSIAAHTIQTASLDPEQTVSAILNALGVSL